MSDPAEVLEQCPVKLGEHVAGEKLPKNSTFFWWQEGQKPACLAGERHEELMAAFRAAHAGATLFEIAALEKLADHLGDYVAEDAVAGLVALGIDLEKLLEMGVDAAPEEEKLSGCGAGRLAPPYRPV